MYKDNKLFNSHEELKQYKSVGIRSVNFKRNENELGGATRRIPDPSADQRNVVTKWG